MKIYESPDKGKTIYVREHCSIERKRLYQSYQEMIDDEWYMTEDGFWVK